MITRQMLFPLAFYQKAKFHGSKGKYNYRIEKYMGEEGDYEDGAERLKLDIITGNAPDVIAVSGLDYQRMGWKRYGRR